MHLRHSLVLAGAALAIGVPAASAQIPWDSIPQASTTVKDYAGLERASHSYHAASGSSYDPITENSFGQSRPSSRQAGTDIRTSAKKSAGKLFAWDPLTENSDGQSK
jgi:hypothetical protein